MSTSSNCFSLLCWNVRGLNDADKRALVRESVVSSGVSVVCFQESKLEEVDASIVVETCGAAFDSFVALPAEQTRGGVIVAWNGTMFRGVSAHQGRWSITVKLDWILGDRSWFLTSVYGPQLDAEKLLFLDELIEVRNCCQGQWKVSGDFNLIAAAADKNNNRINRRMMNAFRNKLNELELRDMYLFGRRYTWSNEQQRPTLEKLDRVLVTTQWEESFPEAHLQALSSSGSDHCPLLLTCGDTGAKTRRFRFESYWTKIEGFADVVQESWDQAVDLDDPYLVLHVKLARLCKQLSKWGQRKISKFRLQMQIANEIILRFDIAQESRLLSDDERYLRAACKGRCLALASLERIRLRQRARIRSLREGDAGTAFFHLKIKARRRKLLIPILEHDGRIATTQHDMQSLAREYFAAVMCPECSDTKLLQFHHIQMATTDLSSLDSPFTEDEIWSAIRALPNEKSPGPDGYTCLFYQRCWEIIKPELISALAKFCTGNSQNLEKLNSAIVTLIPKKDSPTLLKDYRPISLIHSFSKIAAKIMAQRLAPKLNVLIPSSQTAFIKGRCIHENFVFVKGLVQQFHRQRKAMMLLKLDISKAFDTVSWGFLMSMLQFRGFGPLWRRWLSAVFLTAETRILINGVLSDTIKPARGLRQGDPLSPLLFVLVMDALQAIVSQARMARLLSPLNVRQNLPPISVYTDDAVLFFRPTDSSSHQGYPGVVRGCHRSQNQFLQKRNHSNPM